MNPYEGMSEEPSIHHAFCGYNRLIIIIFFRKDYRITQAIALEIVRPISFPGEIVSLVYLSLTVHAVFPSPLP